MPKVPSTPWRVKRAPSSTETLTTAIALPSSLVSAGRVSPSARTTSTPRLSTQRSTRSAMSAWPSQT